MDQEREKGFKILYKQIIRKILYKQIMGKILYKAMLFWKNFSQAILHSIVEEVEHCYVVQIVPGKSSILVWRVFWPLRQPWYFFEREDKLEKRMRKGTSLSRILNTISQIILLKCLTFLNFIHLLLLAVNKGIPFPLLGWPSCFIKNYLCVCFLVFSLRCVCIVLTIYSALFTQVCSLTTTNSICDFFVGNNQLLRRCLLVPHSNKYTTTLLFI